MALTVLVGALRYNAEMQKKTEEDNLVHRTFEGTVKFFDDDGVIISPYWNADREIAFCYDTRTACIDENLKIGVKERSFMVCPFCGGPMREGYILNPRRDMGTVWYPCDVTPPLLFSVKRTYERGGILLSDDKFFSGGSNLRADICFSCGKGVFSIKDEDKTY